MYCKMNININETIRSLYGHTSFEGDYTMRAIRFKNERLGITLEHCNYCGNYCDTKTPIMSPVVAERIFCRCFYMPSQNEYYNNDDDDDGDDDELCTNIQ